MAVILLLLSYLLTEEAHRKVMTTNGPGNNPHMIQIK